MSSPGASAGRTSSRAIASSKAAARPVRWRNQRRVEPHADDRRRLQRRLVGRRQPVQAREHDVGDRAGQRVAFRAALQQLRQEQRVALRARDASPRDVGMRFEDRLREFERLVDRERCEIGDRRSDPRASVPTRDRLRGATSARARSGAPAHGRRAPRARRSPQARPSGGPRRRAPAALRRDARTATSASASIRPRRRVAGSIASKRPPGALRRAEQVGDERLVLVAHEAVGDGAVERGARDVVAVGRSRRRRASARARPPRRVPGRRRSRRPMRGAPRSRLRRRRSRAPLRGASCRVPGRREGATRRRGPCRATTRAARRSAHAPKRARPGDGARGPVRGSRARATPASRARSRARRRFRATPRRGASPAPRARRRTPSSRPRRRAPRDATPGSPRPR